MIAGAGNNNVYTCNRCIELCFETPGEELEDQDEGRGPALADIRPLKPKEVKAFLDEYVIRQNDAKKMLSVAVYNHYRRMTACQNMDMNVQKSNVPMLRPTGSGKTYLTQTLAKILNVPSTIADVTVLTEARYVDEDVENILLKFTQAADYGISRTEYGIIYIDEIDKVTEKPENVSITRDVSDEGAQQALLKILEDTVANAPSQDGRKRPHQELLQVDTTNILFIYGGTFDGLEEVVGQCLSAGSIGFGAEVTDKNNLDTDELLKKAEPKNLTKFGLIPEFTSRTPVMASLEQLTKEATVCILSEPKNALTRQYQKLFEPDNVKLELTRETLREIAQLIVDRGIGARGLHSILELVVMDLMYEVPSNDPIRICTVIRDVVRKAEQPELVYRDMPSASARKPLSEWLRGDSKTGEIAQVVISL